MATDSTSRGGERDGGGGGGGGDRAPPASLPDATLFAYESTTEGGPLRLSKAPALFQLAAALERGALSGYRLPLSLDAEAAAAFAAARAAGSLPAAEDRALGCMLGMAVGDSLGAPFEFLPYREGGVPVSTTGLGEPPLGEVENAFGLKPGQWTDDASMGLCLADSLLAAPGFLFDPLDLMLRFLAWWELGYNNAFAADAARPQKSSVGLGGTIAASLSAFQRSGLAFTRSGDALSSGNGSIMRLAAVPVLHHADEGAAAATARAQSYTTHQGTEAAECAALMAVVVCRAIAAEGAPAERKAAVLDSLAAYTCAACPAVERLARSEAEPGGGADRDWRWKRAPAGAHAFSPTRAAKQPGYVGSYAMDALAMALHCVHATDSAEAALLLAANLRGDCDTVAAITGQVAGAIYGAAALPAKWVALVERWDGGGGIAQRAHCLFHRIPARRG